MALTKVPVVNLDNGHILAEEAILAATFWQRLKGLWGKKSLEKGKEGIILFPCRGVHSFFMKINLDLIFLNPAGIVVHTIPSFPAGKISPCFPEAIYVLEFPEGTLKCSGTKKGQQLVFGGMEMPRPGLRTAVNWYSQ